MFAAIPLLLLPVIIYNVVVLFMDGSFHTKTAAAGFNQPMLWIPMSSGTTWQVTGGDFLLVAALVVLFVEMLKSTDNGHIAVINHSLSMILFIGCLVEFLLFPAFATSTFFLVTVMVLLDVLAGFIVTIAASRREVDVRRD